MYEPKRPDFDHASDAVENVERNNCALGCQHGLEDGMAFADFGPGGTCGLLAIGSLPEPVEEWDYDGDVIFCWARVPL